MNNEEQWLESTNLDLQEGLGSESTELTSLTLESTRGVLESTSTDHSLTGRTLKRRKQSYYKRDNFKLYSSVKTGGLIYASKSEGSSK